MAYNYKSDISRFVSSKFFARRFSRQEYYSFFEDADQDRDGYLTIGELQDVLERFNYPVNEYDLNVSFALYGK